MSGAGQTNFDELVEHAKTEIRDQLGDYMREQTRKITELERQHQALINEIAGECGRFGYRAEQTGNADLAELVGLLRRAIGLGVGS